jgi:hypothetical protein
VCRIPLSGARSTQAAVSADSLAAAPGRSPGHGARSRLLWGASPQAAAHPVVGSWTPAHLVVEAGSTGRGGPLAPIMASIRWLRHCGSMPSASGRTMDAHLPRVSGAATPLCATSPMYVHCASSPLPPLCSASPMFYASMPVRPLALHDSTAGASERRTRQPKACMSGVRSTSEAVESLTRERCLHDVSVTMRSALLLNLSRSRRDPSPHRHVLHTEASNGH